MCLGIKLLHFIEKIKPEIAINWFVLFISHGYDMLCETKSREVYLVLVQWHTKEETKALYAVLGKIVIKFFPPK